MDIHTLFSSLKIALFSREFLPTRSGFYGVTPILKIKGTAKKGIDHSPEISEFVRRRRRELEISQQELANRLGLERHNFITAIESGKSKIPRGQWKKYADALETPRHRFLELLIRSCFPDAGDYICKFCPKGDGSSCCEK